MTTTLETVSTNRNFEPLIDKEEAAILLRCHPNTLLRKVREGAVPFVKGFGRRVFFRASDLNKWVTSGDTAFTVRVA